MLVLCSFMLRCQHVCCIGHVELSVLLASWCFLPHKYYGAVISCYCILHDHVVPSTALVCSTGAPSSNTSP